MRKERETETEVNAEVFAGAEADKGIHGDQAEKTIIMTVAMEINVEKEPVNKERE
jgi:hypothetical protein